MSEKQNFYSKAKEKLTGKFPRFQVLLKNIKNTLTRSSEPGEKLTKLELSDSSVHLIEKYILGNEYNPAFRGGDRRAYQIEPTPELPPSQIIEETINIFYETESGRVMSPPRDQEWQDNQFSILRTYFWKIQTITDDEQPTTYYHLFADYPPDHLFTQMSPSDLSKGVEALPELELEEELKIKKIELETVLSATLKSVQSGEERDIEAWKNLTQNLNAINAKLGLITTRRRKKLESIDADSLIVEAQQQLIKREFYSDSIPGRSPIQPERLSYQDYNAYGWRQVGEQIDEHNFSSSDLEIRKSIQLFNQQHNPPKPLLEHLIKARTPKSNT